MVKKYKQEKKVPDICVCVRDTKLEFPINTVFLRKMPSSNTIGVQERKLTMKSIKMKIKGGII